MAANEYVYVANKGFAKKLEGTRPGKTKVLLAGRQKASWVSNTQIVAAPEEILAVKGAEFDQKCGCVAAVEYRDGKVRTFNLYGSVKKYQAAPEELKQPISTTPHHRRKFLKEHGFTCAKGNPPRELENVAEYFFEKGHKKDKKGNAYVLK